ncbi:hypothetical protein GIB67_042163 [Kingdonia uniflora]|uniref:Pentatricopeptide repeat-containing protein n=1 Tax=Kingdonia uniflora TaxID=39325 RepID=A0A7J7NXK9_9MAGN|nr:hypothetical protein GIB67_042163 [Kingdonia uniflora]
MYAKCNSLCDACKVFDGIWEANLANPVNWNTAISCFFRGGDHKDTIATMFYACGQLRDLCFGEQVHGYAIKISLYIENDGFAKSFLVYLYGYVENDCQDEDWEIFCSMHQGGSATPNSVTMAIVTLLCTMTSSLHYGKKVHCYSLQSGLTENIFVGNNLLNMSSKCGKLHVAENQFKMIVKNDRIT